MDIGSVLSRAWQIIWKHKVLWIFGILAGCATTRGGNNLSNRANRGDLSPYIQQYVNQVPSWVIAVIVGGLILVALIIIIVAIFLGTVGKIGLIRGTQQADQGATHLAFGELFNGSLPYFWRVFGLTLLVGIITAVVFGAIFLMGILGTVVTFGLGALCLIPLICLAVPVAWFIGLVVEQAINAIVIENLGITAGFQRGWEVVKANVGTMILMALILFLGVGVIGGFIIGLPLALVVAPALVSYLANNQQPTGGGLLVSAVCFVAYLPVLLVASGILNGYTGSAWTLTFMRLTGRQAYSEPQPLQPAYTPPAPEQPSIAPAPEEPAHDEPTQGDPTVGS